MLKPLRIATLVVLLALLVLGGTSALMAQSSLDGGISGVITDQTNAVVTGATVTVRNQDTNEQFTATADSAGGFRVVRLRPGNYEVTITAGGFAPFKASSIVVEVGRVTRVEAKLAVGGKSTSVDVTGEAPVINTVQPDYSNNVNLQALTDLPINMRRWSSFALTTPGATADGFYGLVAFRGISGLLNSNTVDGGDNNSAYWSEERGRTRATATISQDAIREFQVNASNFSAEYGHAAGAVVNAVTKSGGNQFHGMAHVFNTDSVMWAKSPFATQKLTDGSTVVIKPDDRRWQMGANIGGPIKKDKLFFFFNWDQQRENAPGLATPPASFWNAITAATTTNCASRNNTAGQTLWCRFNRVIVPSGSTTVAPPATPSVSTAQVQTYIANAFSYVQALTGTIERGKNQYVLFPKIDWIITPKHTFTGSWNHMRWRSKNGVQTSAIVNRADWGDDNVDVDTVNGRLVSLLTNTMTNEFRTSIGRENQFEPLNQLFPGEPTTGPGGLPPEINLPGYTFGKPYYNDRLAYPLEMRYQFADTMTLALGNSMLKWGFDINHSKDQIDHLYQNGGAYSYSNIYDWIADFTTPSGLCTVKNSANANVLAPCYNTFNQGMGPTKYEFATNDFAIFVQDDWHVLPRLTLNAGIRWDYQQMPKPFWPNPLLPRTSYVPSDKQDIGPRVGFAYDVTGDGKTVVRGGYGIYYGRIINAYLGGELTGTGIVGSQLSTGSLKPCQAGDTGCLSPVYPQTFLGTPPKPCDTVTSGTCLKTAPSLWGDTVKSPMVHQMDLVVEREITKNTVLSLSYLMSAGRRLPFVIDQNIAAATTFTNWTINGGPENGAVYRLPLYTTRTNTKYNNMYYLQDIASSRYDGLILQVRRRMTKGLQVDASYTHARTTDTNQHTGTGPTGQDPLDPYNLLLERGTSSFDIRHKLSFAAVYQPSVNFNHTLGLIFNGFTISPVFAVSSGVPLAAGISGSASGGVGSGILGAGGSNRAPWMAKYPFRGETTGGANLRVSRRFKITESKRVEFAADVFNLTNHMFPTQFSTTLYQISGTTLNYCGMGSTTTGLCSSSIPGYGTIQNGNNQDRVDMSPRKFQLGARFEF